MLFTCGLLFRVLFVIVFDFVVYYGFCWVFVYYIVFSFVLFCWLFVGFVWLFSVWFGGCVVYLLCALGFGVYVCVAAYLVSFLLDCVVFVCLDASFWLCLGYDVMWFIVWFECLLFAGFVDTILFC